MREWEIRRIAPISVFKITSLAGMAIGSLLAFLLRAMPLPGLPPPAELSTPVGALLFGAFYGLMIGLAYTVAAWLYNLLAVLFGGITVQLAPRDAGLDRPGEPTSGPEGPAG